MSINELVQKIQAILLLQKLLLDVNLYFMSWNSEQSTPNS